MTASKRMRPPQRGQVSGVMRKALAAFLAVVLGPMAFGAAFGALRGRTPAGAEARSDPRARARTAWPVAAIRGEAR